MNDDKVLIEYSKRKYAEDARGPSLKDFTKNEEANKLLCDIKSYPHAFVIACIMDRQIKAEKAWEIPYAIKKKLGRFDFKYLSTLSESEWKRLFNESSLHRFNNMSAEYVYEAIQKIKQDYNGDASKIWNDNPSSATVVLRFLEFKGIGIKIATMAANILARYYKIPMKDRYSIDISPDVHVRRVLERLGYVEKDCPRDQIIYKARELNPEYPGLLDVGCWQIGKNLCHPNNPDCEHCPMKDFCQFKANSQTKSTK